MHRRCLNVIHDAQVRRSGRRHDSEDLGTGRSCGDCGGDGIAAQPLSSIHRCEEHIDTHHSGRRVDRRVGTLGSNDGPPLRTAGSRIPASPVGVMSGRDQRREVPHRAAGDEASAGGVRHVGQVGYPTQGLVLGEDHAGAVEPGGSTQ